MYGERRPRRLVGRDSAEYSSCRPVFDETFRIDIETKQPLPYTLYSVVHRD